MAGAWRIAVLRRPGGCRSCTTQSGRTLAGSDPIRKWLSRGDRGDRHSRGSWRLELAPPPAWAAPRVGQDHGRCLAWTLLHLGLAVRATHLGFDLPQGAIGTDVDVAACDP